MPNNYEMDRRTFLKLLGSGLITTGVIASGLAFPHAVAAYEPCTSVNCNLAYAFYTCVDNCLYLILGYFCWDTRTGEFCGSYENGGRVGSC